LTGASVKKYYPSKILGFVKMSGTPEAITQCSEKPLIWSEVENMFLVKTKIGTDMDVSYVSVPISALVHPLCVIPASGVISHPTSLYCQSAIGVDILVIKCNLNTINH